MSKYKSLAEKIKIVALMRVKLEETDDLCKAIAIDATGRDDTGERMFKTITGMSMAQYRQEIRKVSQ